LVQALRKGRKVKKDSYLFICIRKPKELQVFIWTRRFLSEVLLSVVVVGLPCATTNFSVCVLICVFGLLCSLLPVGLLTGCSCCWIFKDISSKNKLYIAFHGCFRLVDDCFLGFLVVVMLFQASFFNMVVALCKLVVNLGLG